MDIANNAPTIEVIVGILGVVMPVAGCDVGHRPARRCRRT